jgi:hypothetical protein
MPYSIVSILIHVNARSHSHVTVQNIRFTTLLFTQCDPYNKDWHTFYVLHSNLYCVRKLMTHSDAREGKWRGNWRMEWVASTLTRTRNVVYPALLTLMRTPRLPAVDWTDSPADLNGLVRLGERRNVVSARVPSGSARALPKYGIWSFKN